jgi:hypothetical protein
MPHRPPAPPWPPRRTGAPLAGVSPERRWRARELRALLRHDLACLRGFRRDGARWAAAPAARRLERQIRHNWVCYRGALAAERRAAAAPPPLAEARRRVRDALGRLQAVRVGRLTGRAFRTAAAESGLAEALAAYRAARRAARRALHRALTAARSSTS